MVTKITYMTAAKSFKLLGALVLLASITLPMATCTHYENSKGERINLVTSEGIPEDAKKVVDSKYVFEKFKPLSPESWIILLAFIWPVLVLIALQWKQRGRVALVIRGFEPLLLAGSFFVVDFISTFWGDSRAIGAYLAFTALVFYAIGTLWCDIILYISWKNQRHT